MRKLLIGTLILLLCSVSVGSSGLYLRKKTFYQRYGVSAEGLVLCLNQSDGRSYGGPASWGDMSGEGNHAVQAVGARQPVIAGTLGLAGACRDFDGTADTMVHPTIISGDIDYTIAGWVKLDDKDDKLVLLAKGVNLRGGLATGQEYALFYDTGPDRLVFLISDQTNAQLVAATTLGSPTADVWYFLVGIHSATDNKVYIFVDGVLDNSANTTVTPSASTGTSNVGSWDLVSVNPKFFDGKISVVFGFTRQLTAAEIQRLHLSDAPRHGGL